LGTDLDSNDITLQGISAVDCNSAPFGSSILSENVIVRMEIPPFLVVFLSQDSDTATTSGLAECAKAVGDKLREEASYVNMHETKAFTVTEVNK
jgi:hypothetical protein